MGTRGVWGFVIDGQEKLAYNHFDSYPSGLGNDLLKMLDKMEIDKDGLVAKARALRVVGENEKPTPEDVEKCKAAGTVDLGVSHQSLDDWYCLLRNAQGDLAKTLEVGIMEDGSAFPSDSLFCEWGYVFDLDNGKLEVYRGFQQKPHGLGRFAGRKGRAGYYPIKLVAEYQLDNLPVSLTPLEDPDADD